MEELEASSSKNQTAEDRETNSSKNQIVKLDRARHSNETQ